MIQHRSGLTVFLLFAAAVWTVCGTCPAGEKDDQRRRHEQWKHQQRMEYDLRIRENQLRLEALRREESVIRRQVQHVESQLPSARTELKQQQAELEAIEHGVAAARSASDEAEQNVKYMAQRLADTVKQVEESQPSSSPFARARSTYLAGREAYNRAVGKITDSPEYKAAYQQAVDSPNRTTLMLQVKKQWIDDDQAVAKARDEVTQAKETYERLRTDVLGNSSAWKLASEALKRARNEEADLQQQARSLAGKQASRKRSVAAFGREVKTMEAALPRGKAALQRIPHMMRELAHQIEYDRHARNRIR